MADETTPKPELTVRKNEKLGQVTSAKMAKTIVVVVTRRVPHPLYKRIVTKKKKFYAHDEENSAKVGDVVRILEHRPLSKLKRWTLGDVVRRAVQVGVEPSVLADPNIETAKAGSKTLNKTPSKPIGKKNKK